MKKLLHIAPQLPPAVDGVGDYCWHLWRHWPEPATWQFAAGGNIEATMEMWPDARVHRITPSASGLASTLAASEADAVVLHYVGYGYHPKGVPLWLPGALERWKADTGQTLVTMFHEMYASSSPLRSPFWVKPWARQVIRRLVRLSDAWITSCERYAGQLKEEFGAREDAGWQLPIPPNVPSAVDLAEDRSWPLERGGKLRIVVFGLPNTRFRALQRHARLLAELVRAGLVDSILLLGKGDNSPGYVSRINDCKRRVGGAWRELFDLPPAEVAEALAACDIGLVANEPDILTKSGVFAALTNNGVVAIVSARRGTAIPAPFADGALLNEDDGDISAVVAELRGSNRMIARRRATLRAGQEELSWDQVARGFSEAVAGARPSLSSKRRVSIEAESHVDPLRARV